MRNLIYILLILLGIFSCARENEIIGKYTFEDYSSFVTIELNKNKTFKYNYIHDSCLLWQDRSGKWSLNSDTLVLVDIVEWEDEALLTREFIDSESDQIIIKVVDENEESLSNVSIEYDIPLTDYEIQTDSTDTNGFVKFIKLNLNKEMLERKAIITVNYENLNYNVFSVVMPRLTNNVIQIKLHTLPQVTVIERVEKYIVLDNVLKGLNGNSLDPGDKYVKIN